MMNTNPLDEMRSTQPEVDAKDKRRNSLRLVSSASRKQQAPSIAKPPPYTRRQKAGSSYSSSCSPSSLVSFASYQDSDVLFGRGGLTNHHPGNQAYRRAIESGKVEYKSLKCSADKRLFLNRFYETFREEHDARFLMKEQKKMSNGSSPTKPSGTPPTLWCEVPKTKALGKIRQALTEAHYQKKERKSKRKSNSNREADGAPEQQQGASKDQRKTPKTPQAPSNSPCEEEKEESGAFVPDPTVFLVKGHDDWLSANGFIPNENENEKDLLDSFDFDLNSSGQFFFDAEAEFISDDSDDSMQADEDSVRSNATASSAGGVVSSSVLNETGFLLKQLEASLANSLPPSTE